jgi:FtsH-binding integral membrane protein
MTFGITAGMFGVTSLFGYVTKMNLSGIGGFCFMGLIGIIIASIVNIFLQSPAVYYAISYLGVFIFIGLTAWDTQKIKNLAMEMDMGLANSDSGQKYAIYGALTLYLDFINMFLFLLRIFGGGRK